MNRPQPFYLDDIDVIETVSEVAKNAGMIGLGGGLGMKIMSESLFQTFCFQQQTFQGPVFLIGEGCAAAHQQATNQILQWLGLGALLVAIGVALMIYGRDDNE